MIPEFEKLRLPTISPDLKTGIQYMDFVEINRDKIPVDDIGEIWEVLEEQCELSLIEVRKTKNEIPVAIKFFTLPHPSTKTLTLFGWRAWTIKQ